MSLRDIINSGVAVANSVTKPLQTQVEYRQLISADGEGKRTYNPDVALPAVLLDVLLEAKQKSVKTKNGDLTVSSVTLTVVDVAQVLAATNNLGIAEDYTIVLVGANATTTPILTTGGFIDPGTGVPFATEVYLG